MARWQWRTWAYATGIPQIAWTVRQVRRLRRPSTPLQRVAAHLLNDDDTEWFSKPLASGHSWMVVVIHGREKPATTHRPASPDTTEDTAR